MKPSRTAPRAADHDAGRTRRRTAKKDNQPSRDRIARLFLLLDAKLENLEKRHAAGAEALSSADHEKDARLMMSLVRVYDKLLELQERADAKASRKAKETSEEGPDSHAAERLCRDLAERIDRLRQQTQIASDSSETKRR